MSYFVARSSVGAPSDLTCRLNSDHVTDPPDALKLQLFPWIEAEEEKLRHRVRSNGRSQDFALQNLFKILRWFRPVLLQDAAILLDLLPDAPVFQFVPFNLPEFRSWAGVVPERCRELEQAADAAFQNVPEALATGVSPP